MGNEGCGVCFEGLEDGGELSKGERRSDMSGKLRVEPGKERRWDERRSRWREEIEEGRTLETRQR